MGFKYRWDASTRQVNYTFCHLLLVTEIGNYYNLPTTTFGWRNNGLNNSSICHFPWWYLCLVKVGSLLKSVFATWCCNQAADMGTHSRWQVINSNTTHQPARNDLACWKYVGSLNLCNRCSIQFSFMSVKRQWQQWQVTFHRDKRSARSTQVSIQYNLSVAYSKQSATNMEKRQVNPQHTVTWQWRKSRLKIKRCGFVQKSIWNITVVVKTFNLRKWHCFFVFF